ncbi:hypothetical protein [Streptomyces iconiensis]|uniref:Lipoprotein n=1 Tax=Streptomyces iconiensis TaxID=1384038 RepID=A0ABT6ZXF6_9ACTN|nr:hypothetical protein [Streptomyces iconiensis]MDJ1133740.1 hypothetical protein [Streptomyces iconiensis]
MRTSARMTGAMAAAAAVALLVSGCGSGNDGGGDGGDGADGKNKPTAEPSPTAEKTASGNGGNGGGKGELAGVWTARADGQKLMLTVVGDAASLLRDKKMCSGRVMKSAGESALVLKCPAGVGEERSTGKIGSVSAKALKVTWNGGETDTYARVAQAPAKLPKDVSDLDKLPDLSDKLKDVTEEPGKVREYPGN